MVDVIYTEKFEREFKKTDASVKEKIRKQIKKIIENPQTGKPLRYNLKGERTVYVKPFRIIYSFSNDTLYFLRFEHREEVYSQ
ncbi:MAG: type II toxin-antitoxin system RelE/ParE family toxin [Nanoarchaeota archaeon]|nr:type II toxin-antitoxin system RelE/ParE family toxin [Nanoarchaeota archaeon]MBU0976910.1 type II toxin-antitoxin system RelE/ParE family toxin [Nanoarchaeota archaeon]